PWPGRARFLLAHGRTTRAVWWRGDYAPGVDAGCWWPRRRGADEPGGAQWQARQVQAGRRGAQGAASSPRTRRGYQPPVAGISERRGGGRDDQYRPQEVPTDEHDLWSAQF